MGNNNNIINWPKVLSFQELTQFLDRKDLIELSLSNHSLRYQLSPLIFKSICLSKNSIINHLINRKEDNAYNHALEEYTIYNRGDFDYSCNKSKHTDLENESMEKVLGTSLIRIREYVKSFKLVQLFNSCCFAFPLAYVFNNLEKLEIRGSSIYYDDLINLGDKFEKLKDLVLVSGLIFNYNEKAEFSMFNLPKGLENIEIRQCRKYRSSTIDSVIDEAEYFSSIAANRMEMLFPIPIASLKRLRLFNFKDFEDYLKMYLKLNPQLEALEIISDFVAQDQVEYIANECHNLTEIFISYNFREHEISPFPTFRYIKKLKFGDFGFKNFKMLQKFCENCPELDHLVLNIDANGYNSELEEFLKKIAPTLHNLRTLKINFLTRVDLCPMYFCELKNIQTLIIRCPKPKKLEINANQLPPQRLKVKVECTISGKRLNFINKAL